jgi:murein DD-endopeptidase MepM/ murein hydrolase activator NlpD
MMRFLKARSGWFARLVSLWLLMFGSIGPVANVSAMELTQQAAPIEHVVEAGETLFGIAQQYGTTVAVIVEANDITDPSLIAVGQKLVIPPAGSEESVIDDPAVDPTLRNLSTYFVLPGDTLDVVARRFDTTITILAELNGVANPATLFPGSTLRVPDTSAGRLHRVAQGETALGLALRQDLSLWEFLAVNGLTSWGDILPGQRVMVPSKAITDTLPAPFLTLDVGPLPILQGHTVSVRVNLAAGATLRGVFADEVLKFAVEEETHIALLGIHALADPVVYPLALLATDSAGNEVYVTRAIEVLDGGYDYEEIVLSPDRDALLDPVAVAAENARLAEIEVIFTPERHWDGLFLRPIETELTSLFGTRRLYKSPSYESYGYHAGNDFDGDIGSPVYAPAPGVVVLAEPLFVRGNALIIDHGWGVFTGYWHLSQIDVQVGQQIEPGDQIALVGDTGLSTGPHLHWDFWVNGTNVDALQWTEQVFP